MTDERSSSEASAVALASRDAEIRPYRLDDLTVRDILNRLSDHVDSIAEVDWDYFAGLRYRADARQAVSDLWRLKNHIAALTSARTSAECSSPSISPSSPGPVRSET